MFHAGIDNCLLIPSFAQIRATVFAMRSAAALFAIVAALSGAATTHASAVASTGESQRD